LRFNPLGAVDARMGVVVRDREHKRRRRSFPYENRAYPSKPVARCLDLPVYHRLVKVLRPTLGRGLCGILHMDFYEKAHFVKPTWRPCIVAECNGCAPFALCFYPHFRGATLLGGSVHYEIRLDSD
jgi:hypothetical protein